MILENIKVVGDLVAKLVKKEFAVEMETWHVTNLSAEEIVDIFMSAMTDGKSDSNEDSDEGTE